MTIAPIAPTLSQTPEEQTRSKERSLAHTRPPLDVPGYESERFLGAGAYGEVWVARDRNTGRRVAIKYYTHRGGLDWSLLSREVEKLSFLFGDRYVVQLFGVGWEAEPPYYVMEYLDHGSLADRLKQGPLPVAEAVSLFREIAVGLVHAHGKGVLHCDLKPANVLLDQDNHPRLADFGQSRMSNEQRPALGTLFYMAPEQANLHAVPDAKWDVYGLGAVLYCMLTGEPPYRTDSTATLVTQGHSLPEQLERYVRLLHESPRPTAHRRVPGVSRDLADLVDRCLSIHPSKRFANPQMVIDALQTRVARRARRPLLILGALGPMLLLAVMILFFWSGAETSVKDFEAAQVERSLDSNRFAARFVAELVGEQIDRRWATLTDEAMDPQLRAQLTSATGKAVSDPSRTTLQTMVDSLRKEHPELTATHWFLLDRHGTQLAASPLDPRTANKNFAFRDYFNGTGRDLSTHPADATPIHEPHRSHVYRDVSDRLALAFTVPVWSGRDGIDDQRVIGVLGISVELGNFAVLRPENAQGKDRFASLVDTLADGSPKPRAGLILEHASTGEKQQVEGPYPQVYVEDGQLQRLLKLEDLVLKAEDKRSAEITRLEAKDDYQDPFDGKYAGRWLAAFQPVMVHYPHPYEQREINTHWVVVVQERFDDAVHPVRLLGHRLLDWGLEGLGVVLAVVTALWLFVILVMNETPIFRWGRRLRKRAGLPVTASGSSSVGSGTGSGTPGSLAAIAAENDSGLSGTE
ncbi:MAG TPA: serine/threonine protein kinase [Pirellulales bacterium]|jgi:hypothetical protein|nr:serine/threonine protein kinase [Pirellulales bacterium]